MNIFLLQQVDTTVGQNLSYFQSMVSFVKKSDGFTYGYYFDVGNQQKIDRKTLTKNHEPIQLDPGATFQSVNLLETYNNVNGMTMILSYGSTYATLQYNNDAKYFYELMTLNGVVNLMDSETHLIGLSKNLEKYLGKQC